MPRRTSHAEFVFGVARPVQIALENMRTGFDDLARLAGGADHRGKFLRAQPA